MERIQRREHDKVQDDEAEAPQLGAPTRFAASNASREAMAMRARAARAGGGQAVEGGAADAAQRAGIGDVSDVRLHTGSEAAEAAAAVSAKAFTVGSDVYFGAGQYAPGTRAGDQLLGHELAHATQQRGAAPEVAAKLEVTDGADAVEAEADVAGGAFARAARGEAVDPVALTSSPAAIAREAETHTPPAADEELLSDGKARSAVHYNKGRHLPEDAWAKIAAVVGAPSATLDTALVQKVAEFQKGQSFDVDGKVGDITLQRISQQPAGAGLDELVKSNNVLYLGANPDSRETELQTLKGTGANVSGVTGARTNDTAKVDGRTVDLNTDEGVESLAASFPLLDAARQAQLKAFFGGSMSGVKDELAQLARLLYEAEFGKRLFKRVVLSGHSGGSSIYGHEADGSISSISFSTLAELTKIFPNAALQVEDVMLSACNTGQKGILDQYTAIFPNIHSVWGYVGYSPDASSGSKRHIKEWEKASRGGVDEEKLDAEREKVGQGGGKNDKHVAVWTKGADGAAGTYKTDSDEANRDFATLKATVDSGMAAYEDAYKNGNIDQTALNALFPNLKTLTDNFSDDLGDQAAVYKEAKRLVFVLRHWRELMQWFKAGHGAELKAAWGDSMPRDFHTASRAKVLQYLEAFPDKTSDVYGRTVTLLRDLYGVPDEY